ncbi:hydantoin utilization protein A [Aeropyrum pernix K1]|uniref:Hydantoin utilization protein A n=1 Tax=Aeropyrum pernix (strain ATCC 700893 / DSM 11879 / JCM 9820 / NBRC 100138 / K1) TaxID=272557 RepID=Q9YCC8_AERPE|nr:hydantoinase/oxoprolinase family protein [Aeropyrum pernix]BAA80320.2 hydantoin utilization protein A [Aeropyrum pernix K1]
MPRVRVGVDVGGTFTDIVVFDGGLRVLKVLTTPKRPVEGVMNGLSRALGTLEGVEVLVHATTIGTNLFLGQVGLQAPRIALFVNEGFRDIVEIGRQNRPSLYNPLYRRPKPLVPRDLRIGVRGRIGPDGVEIERLDVDAVREWAARLCREGVRVYAVSFLHSHRNPLHEKMAAQAVGEACPGAYVVTGHEVDPQPMEYERTSTTVVNAVLKPILSTYLQELHRQLRDRGFKGVLLVMQSNGGVAGVEEAVGRPAAFIESGPSAGAVAVAYFSRLQRVDRALGFDMGGTTAKASSIIDGEPEVVDTYEVGGRVHMGRLIRGSGYPVRYPHIDLAEVSAGGGTIAWVDPGGALQVGPMSAGADPGPACYGLGGSKPTVTDANLILGRLPDVLAGGLRLSRRLAEDAVKGRVAEPMGLDVVEAAWAIVRIANAIMSRALRLVSLERGRDPRGFTMYAFGGAGPLHAAELAEEMGVSRVIIPPFPGVFSALGLLVADYKHSLHAPVARPASSVSQDELDRVFEKLRERADEVLARESVPPERRIYSMMLDMRYWGQAYPLRVPYRGSLDDAVREFHRLHAERYGFASPEEPVEVDVARLEAVGLTEKPVLQKPVGAGEPAPRRAREVFFEEGWLETPLYRYEDLAPGYRLEGPAVVEAPDSTILLPPGWAGVVDGYGALVMERR